MGEKFTDRYIEIQIRGFYNRVVGSRYKNDLLDGAAGIISNCAFYHDLKKFEQFIIEQKRPVPKELIEAIEELHFSIQIINKSITVKEILHSITSLSYGSNSVIIPGGFYNDEIKEGHGVIYKIDREINGTFSFTVINSGSGGDLGLNPQFLNSNNKNNDKLFKLLDLLHTDLPVNKKNDKIFKVFDLVYTGLAADKITEEFINQLTDDHKFKNMENVNSFIKNQFAEAKTEKGHSHNPQSKGNCGFKCISFYLSKKLGPLLYQEFKVFFTELESKNLMSLRRSDTLKDKIVSCNGDIIPTKETIDTLVFQGQLTLNRRMKKLEPLKAS